MIIKKFVDYFFHSKEDRRKGHDDVVMNIRKLVDSICPDKVSNLTINDIVVNDYYGYYFQGYVPAGDVNYIDKVKYPYVDDREGWGFIEIILQQDDLNFVGIILPYIKYKFQMDKWYQFYFSKGDFKYKTVVNKEIYDEIYTYLSYMYLINKK